MKLENKVLPYNSRRTMLASLAKSLFGVSLLPATSLLGADSKSSATNKTKINRVIYLFMNGGMSHLDTFDLKPGSSTQGETKPIQTKIPGIEFGHFLPKLATQADKLAVIRSLHTETGAHDQGRYLMRTSYKQISGTRHPTIGAWAHKFLGKQNKNLPGSVVVSGEAQHPGAGFLETAYSPLPIGNPSAGLQNTKTPKYLTPAAFRKRMSLIRLFDDSFQSRYKQKKVRAYNDFYDQATRLMASAELKAFDLNEESKETRERYGMTSLGTTVDREEGSVGGSDV